MAEGTCATCTRYVLIIFNLIFGIMGIALLGVGIWAVASDPKDISILEHIKHLGDNVLEVLAYTAIGIGSFMFFIGYFGCCGSIRESGCMLVIHVILMSCLLLVEIGAIIYAVAERSTIESVLKTKLIEDVHNYTIGGENEMDFLQTKFSCCGANNYTDYRKTHNFKYSNYDMNRDVPDSCCLTSNRTMPAKPVNGTECQKAAKADDLTSKYLYTKGCFTYFKELVQNNGAIMLGVIGGIMVIEIIGIICAVYLYRNRTDYDLYDD